MSWKKAICVEMLKSRNFVRIQKHDFTPFGDMEKANCCRKSKTQRFPTDPKTLNQHFLVSWKKSFNAEMLNSMAVLIISRPKKYIIFGYFSDIFLFFSTGSKVL